MTPQQRTAIYTLTAAIGLVLGSFGVVTTTQWATVSALVVAVIGCVTAFVHRPTKV